MIESILGMVIREDLMNDKTRNGFKKLAWKGKKRDTGMMGSYTRAEMLKL
jgi:hypothetical protein